VSCGIFILLNFKANPDEHEGDRTYLAPEFWNSSHVGTPADIFSLGLIGLEAAANIILPENGPQWAALRESDFSVVDFGNTSMPLIDLISSMLIPDPQKRPTASDILSHPLIKKFSA
jgi:serine/threonine protein kinase